MIYVNIFSTTLLLDVKQVMFNIRMSKQLLCFLNMHDIFTKEGVWYWSYNKPSGWMGWQYTNPAIERFTILSIFAMHFCITKPSNYNFPCIHGYTYLIARFKSLM